jgi:hypothetical protein
VNTNHKRARFIFSNVETGLVATVLKSQGSNFYVILEREENQLGIAGSASVSWTSGCKTKYEAITDALAWVRGEKQLPVARLEKRKA